MIGAQVELGKGSNSNKWIIDKENQCKSSSCNLKIFIYNILFLTKSKGKFLQMDTK